MAEQGQGSSGPMDGRKTSANRAGSKDRPTDGRATRHLTEMAWVIDVLRRHPELDFSVKELHAWQDEPKAFDAYSIAMALEELGRQGLAVKGLHEGSAVPYWACTASE